MMRWLLVASMAAVALGLAAFELLMDPSPEDRLVLYSVFGGVALIAGAVAVTAPRLAQRARTLRAAVLVPAVAALGVAALAVAASALSMFFDSHDLSLLLVALALGVGLGITLAVAVSRRLTDDLERLTSTARAVGEGDLSMRSGITRRDEVGEVARAMDGMIAALSAAQLERNRQEEARRRLVAAVGHDLRTPLTALRAALEAVRDGLAPDPDRYLEAMVGDVEVLDRLIDDLFLASRLEAGSIELALEEVDLGELVEGAAEALAPVAAERSVGVSVGVGGPVAVRADPVALGRAVRNLLDNAIRHAPADTEVDVDIEKDGGSALVRVRDRGPGFSEDFAARAFDPFTRPDPSRARADGGAGLGLAIARGIVSAHQGTIWIEDGPGGLVAFRIPADHHPPD
jgi:two-component system, OmpR family, sensor histidine kinase BaeS